MRHSLTPLFLVALMTSFVAGCSYTPARIDPEPIVEIGDDDHHHGGHHGHGDFCPPGQAKKGRC